MKKNRNYLFFITPGFVSRHITAHDRIIYDIYEEVVEVYILEVEGHYNDK